MKYSVKSNIVEKLKNMKHIKMKESNKKNQRKNGINLKIIKI